ncbi:hypothetical protein [Aristaeella hokkaidonensis]|uniref:Uncharacterized protein n=1 Tax=Aristaeella hokkaidonensis TaxID=3046382 RepID=A0AC61N7B6_9FIRM|nr:hypothetical protein [Aristaeella hokkaidonensis]QUC66476.1 hypothetical protein JYE49_11475 [Aristaeella hokkaidonensis]SNT94110.1 hypothetical protein SAMN06297421_10480 [Aristaeella hokkaidonensis]
MFGFRQTRRPGIILMAVLLILTLLPLTILADTSVKIYSPYAPEITRWPERHPVENTNVQADPEVHDRDGYSYPWLTDLELVKFREFQTALKDGEIGYAGESIINPTTVTDDDVAVFTLDSNDFCGESYYVFLPDSSSVTDTQMVALAAAFEELGIDFDPDSLNDRNCCRHCNVLETRILTDEENSRMETIKDRIRRGQLTKEDVPEDTQVLTVEKRTMRGWGLDRKTFLFYPYRRMTDDELALFALADEEAWDVDPDELKTAALKDAGELINLPRSVHEYEPCISRELMQIKGDTYLPRSNAVYKYTSQFYFEGYDGFYDRIHCNMDIVQMQEIGSTAETAGIHLWYGYYSTFSDSDYPESHEAEWLAAAQNWAGQVLRLPADVLQDGWTVSYKIEDYGSNLVQLKLVTEEYEICVWVYQNSAKISDCLIFNRNWYDDSLKLLYL